MPGYENIMGESLLRSLWEEVAQARGVTPPPPPPDWRSFIPKASPFNYARALPPASDWVQEMIRAMQAGEFTPKPAPPNWQYYKPPISGPPAVQSGGPGILQRGGVPAIRGAQSLSRMPIPQPTGGGMGSGPAQGFRSLTSGGVPQTMSDIIEGVGSRIGEGRRALGSGIQQLGQGARALGGYAQEVAAPVMSGAAGMASGVAGSGLMGTLAATLPMLLAGGSSGPDELRYAPQYRQQARAESPEQPPMGAMPVSGQGRSVGTPPPPAQPPVPPVGGSAPTPPPQDIPQEGVQWTNMGGPAWRARVHEYDDEKGLVDRGSATFQAPQGWAPGGGGVAFSEGPDNTAEYIKRVDKYVAEGEAQRHRAKLEQLMSSQQNDPYRKQVQEWIPEAVNTALRGGDHAMAASLANLGKSVLGSLDDKDTTKLQQQLLLKGLDQQNRVELQGLKADDPSKVAPPRKFTDRIFQESLGEAHSRGLQGQDAIRYAMEQTSRAQEDYARGGARGSELGKGDPSALDARRKYKLGDMAVREQEAVQKALSGHSTSLGMVQGLKSYWKALNPVEGSNVPGMAGDVSNILRRGAKTGQIMWKQFAQRGEGKVAATYEAERNILLSHFARNVSAERGVLTELDVKKVEAAFPALNDLREVGEAKLANFEALIRLNMEAAKARLDAGGELSPWKLKEYMDRKERLLSGMVEGKVVSDTTAPPAQSVPSTPPWGAAPSARPLVGQPANRPDTPPGKGIKKDGVVYTVKGGVYQ